MKNRIALIIALVVILCSVCCPALAAGKMVVQQENYYTLDNYSVYGYAFAKVENTGDKPAEFSAGLLEIYDANGDTLTSTDYMNCFPKTLMPGETGYIYAYDSIKEAESADVVDDYMLTVTGKSGDEAVTRYPATAEYQKDVPYSKYTSYDYLTAEITNNTDETVFFMNVVIALLDAEGNVLFVDHKDYYDSTGINAGSTITYRCEIYDAWKELWEKKGLTPDHCDVIAYTEAR